MNLPMSIVTEDAGCGMSGVTKPTLRQLQLGAEVEFFGASTGWERRTARREGSLSRLSIVADSMVCLKRLGFVQSAAAPPTWWGRLHC